MDGPRLEFQGVSSFDLLAVLLIGLPALLIVFGLWRLMRRRYRSGLLAATAAVPPLAGALLLADAIAKRWRGQPVPAGGVLGGAVLLAASAGVGALLFVEGGVSFAVGMAAVALVVATAVGVFYAAVYAYLGTQRLMALMALRCAAIAVLLLLLFKPVMSVPPEAESWRPYLPIVVDRSASMATTDAAGLAERYRQAVHMLGTQRKRLGDHFRPVWMHFTDRPALVEDWSALASLSADANEAGSTDIAAAIREAASVRDRRNLAGIVLLTDGLQTAEGDLAAAAVEAGLPIYAIGLGSVEASRSGRPNLEVVSVDAPLEVVQDNVATASVQVRLTALANVAAELKLLPAEGNEPLATARLWTDRNEALLRRQLQWSPRAPRGADADAAEAVRRLRVVAEPLSAEVTEEDNAAPLHVLVTEPRIDVLYIEGTVRPEYKFLWRTLNTDQNVRLMSLIRFAGNRFSAYGQIDGRRLTELPAREEDFALFDVIILGDLDRTFFTDRQLRRLREFVRDGGGLVMLGGHNSFGPGGYAETPIEEVLPVWVGPRNQSQETTPFLPQLTAYGQKHPIFSGVVRYLPGPGGQPPADEDIDLPALRGCVTVTGAKPAATVLAVHPSRRTESGPKVVLAVQSYGTGRAAAFTADTTWQWYLPLRGMGMQSPYRLFWSQMVRWLANVEAGRKQAGASLLARVPRGHLRAGQEIDLSARVKDASGRATDSASVTAVAQLVGGSETPPESRPLMPTQRDGVYRAGWRPGRPGVYRLIFTAVDAAGAELGRDELQLTVAPRARELERLARDQDALAEVARRSEGVSAELAELPEVVDQIVQRRLAQGAFVPEAQTIHLYNFTALFLVFVGLLAGEWLLRRRWQLQ